MRQTIIQFPPFLRLFAQQPGYKVDGSSREIVTVVDIIGFDFDFGFCFVVDRFFVFHLVLLRVVLICESVIVEQVTHLSALVYAFLVVEGQDFCVHQLRSVAVERRSTAKQLVRQGTEAPLKFCVTCPGRITGTTSIKS